MTTRQVLGSPIYMDIAGALARDDRGTDIWAWLNMYMNHHSISVFRELDQISNELTSAARMGIAVVVREL